jgi:FKBP-type peptidyl-prolyl cis-trans isomerase FklB
MRRLSLSIRLLPIGLTILWLSSQALAEAAATPAPANAAPTEPALDVKRASYGVGLTFGAQLRAAGVSDNVAMDSLMGGIKAGMTGTAVSPTDQQQMRAWVRDARDRMQVRNQRAAHEFLTKNSQVAGVVTTTSGLQYKVLNAGDGAATSPKATDQVVVNYSGRLLDGTEFDSSYKRGQPAQFPVTGVIPGWTEALQLMKPGAKWELFIPSNLAYGDSPPPNSPFEPGMMLKFEVELLKVMTPALGSAAPKQAPAATARPASAAPATTAKPAPSGVTKPASASTAR